MGFFDNTSSGVMGASELNELEKALTAGYGTDSSRFVGGRTLIPENLESETMNVVAQLKEDCKIMNSVKKMPVKSTVHEINRRTDHGDWRFISVAEGGASDDTNQSLERVTFDMKYLQTRRSVTKQMEAAETFEGALASEKLAGVETIIKGSEYQCFHGNSDVVPTEFDGFIASIKKAHKKQKSNIISLRGKNILDAGGEDLFNEMATRIYEKGGDVSKVMYPPVLAKDIKAMYEDKGRYVFNSPGNGTINPLFNGGLPDLNAVTGSIIKMSGEGAGIDKFYHVKKQVVSLGNPLLRPDKPKTVTVQANAGVADSSFEAGDAGDYKYTVHAINQNGISEGTEAQGVATVAAGGSVTVTITPGDGVKPTGFIICRSAKGGDVVMEMDAIGNSEQATTVYTDINDELPGTASMLFLTETKIKPVFTFGQLLPVCSYPLAPVNKAENPFLVMMFGSLELRAPEFCGLVKDIKYQGGL